MSVRVASTLMSAGSADICTQLAHAVRNRHRLVAARGRALACPPREVRRIARLGRGPRSRGRLP